MNISSFNALNRNKRGNTFLLLSFFLSCILISACKEKKIDVNYVTSHSPAEISRGDNLFIRFKSPLAKEFPEPNPNLLNIVPSVEGEIKWINDHILTFIPETYLQANTEYTLKINPRYIGQQESSVYEFRCQTRPLFVEADNVDLEILGEDDEEVNLSIPIHFSDAIDEKVKSRISVDVSGADEGYEVRVVEAEGDRNIVLQINELSRIEGEKVDIDLSIRLKDLGMDQNTIENIQLPAPGDFELINADHEYFENSIITLQFSQLLSQRDYSGLIYLHNVDKEKHSYEINQNKLLVYVEGRNEGIHTLKFDDAVSSINGNKLFIDPLEFEFTKAKPELRLTNSGVILPEADKLYFPFAAIGLKAVYLEIVEIPQNNVKQFFQENTLKTNYNLYQVGRLIAGEKIMLNRVSQSAKSGKWMNYAIDLEKYLGERHSSVYHIVLSFKPSYVDNACGNLSDEVKYVSYNSDYGKYNLRTMKDITYSGFASDGDYNYSNRFDPCKGEYYNSQKWISQNVIASDLAINAKYGPAGQLNIDVLSISDASPQVGTNIEVYNYQQQLLFKGQSDARGQLEIDLSEKSSEPYLVKASKGRDFMAIKLSDGTALSMSRFPAKGIGSSGKFRHFFFADREVWRPGDSIFLNLMLDNENHNYRTPATFTVSNPKGKTYLEKTNIHSVGGIYPLYFSVGEDQLTGTYRVKVKMGGNEFSKLIRVESIKPNRLEIKLADYKYNRTTAKVNIPIHAQWLHGAIANNLKYRSQVTSFSKPYTSENFPDYRFEHKEHYSTARDKNLKGKLDVNGNVELDIDLKKSKKNGISNVNVRTRVFETSGEYSHNYRHFSIPEYDAYIGLKMSNSQSTYNLTKVDEQAKFDVLVLNPQDEKIRSANAVYRVSKIDWNWWWESSRGRTSMQDGDNETLLAEEKVRITPSNSEISFTPRESGRYRVEICHENGYCSTLDFYATSSRYFHQAKFSQAGELALTADKDVYKSAEKARISFAGNPGQHALISVEDGRRVLYSDRIEIDSEQTEYEIPLRQDYSPGVYVFVSLIQARQDLIEDLPLRRYGMLYLPVENEEFELQPEIATNSSYKPNSEVEITVSEASGNAMDYVLTLVDEGLLSLTNYNTPEPYNHFFGKQKYAINTWDIYDDVIGPYQKNQRLLAVGGGLDLEKANLENLRRFEPMVRNIGPFHLKKNSKGKHKVKIPNYVGKLRVMLIAKNNGKYGSQDLEVPVEKDLMVLATAPRKMGVNEKFVLPITIFRKAGTTPYVNLNIKQEDLNYDLPGQLPMQVNMEDATEKTVYFTLSTNSHTGTSPLIVSASAGSEKAEYRINMPVVNKRQKLRDYKSHLVLPGKTASAMLPAIGESGSRQSRLFLSSGITPTLYAEAENLRHYPYGCNEQVTSRAFAALLSNAILDSDKSEFDKKYIQKYIDLLEDKQLQNGAWSLWGGDADPWVSSYVGHFLHYAMEEAYPVNSSVVKAWKDYQSNAAKLWSPSLVKYLPSGKVTDLTQAYRLYTMALWKEPLLSEMNRLAESQSLSEEAGIFLASAYSLINRNEKAKEILNRDFNQKQNSEYSVFHSGLRTTAIKTLLFHRMAMEQEALKQFEFLQNKLSNQNYLNTQEIAFSLLANHAILGKAKLNTAIDARVATPGAQEHKVNAVGSSIMNLDLSDTEYGASKSLSITNHASSSIFVGLETTAKHTGIDTRINNGFEVVNKYFNEGGKEIDIDEIESGENIYVQTDVTRDYATVGMGEIKQCVVSQIFPSSWQILPEGGETNTEGKKEIQQTTLYSDIRDDRVNTVFNFQKNTIRIVTKVNVTYQGEYYLPGTSVEAMYNPGLNGRSEGQMIVVRAAK